MVNAYTVAVCIAGCEGNEEAHVDNTRVTSVSVKEDETFSEASSESAISCCCFWSLCKSSFQ